MRRPRGVLVALLSLLLFAALPAQATRSLPDLADAFKAQAPLERSLRLEADVSASEKSLRLFDEADLAFPPRALELEELRYERSCNYDVLTFDYDEGAYLVAESRHFDLRLIGPGGVASRTFPGARPSLFQGAWTDPITGIAYHRNRWYDPRTASWLSEDPAGAVDSPNLYAGFAWAPHVNIDPMGDVVPKNSVVDPEHWMYRYGNKFYQHTVTGMVVELDLPNSSEHHEVKDPVLSEKIREISGKSVHGSTLTVELGQGVKDRVKEEDVLGVAYLYWGACATPVMGGVRLLPNVLGFSNGLAGAAIEAKKGGDLSDQAVAFWWNYWLNANLVRGAQTVNLPATGNFEQLAEFQGVIKNVAAGVISDVTSQIVLGEGEPQERVAKIDLLEVAIAAVMSSTGIAASDTPVVADLLSGLNQTFWVFGYNYGKEETKNFKDCDLPVDIPTAKQDTRFP